MHVGADFLKWPPSSLNKREVAKRGNALHISSLLAFASKERLPCYARSQHQQRLHPTPQWTTSFSLSRGRGAWEIASSLSRRPAERGEGGGRPRRDNSFYTSANEPTERTNFQSPQLFWSSGNSPSIRRRPPGAAAAKVKAALTRTHCALHYGRSSQSFHPNPRSDHPRNTFRFRLSFSPSISLSLSHSPWPLPGVVDVEVVLGAPVPLDEAEAAQELERLQRGSDE